MALPKWSLEKEDGIEGEKQMVEAVCVCEAAGDVDSSMAPLKAKRSKVTNLKLKLDFHKCAVQRQSVNIWYQNEEQGRPQKSIQ